MDFQHLDQFLNHVVRIGPSGCAVSVSLHGKTVYSRCFGLGNLAENAPVTENTVFRLYSVSKVITAVAVLRLYERGALSLNDPVSLYLPEFAQMQVSVQSCNNATTLVPARTPITIRHLLTMTSGLTYGGSHSAVDAATQALYDELNRGSYTVRDFARALASMPLAFEPGTHFRYSYSHDVLGAVVEVISGKPFEQFVKDEIFSPLGMESSAYFFEDLPENPVAAFYNSASGALVEDPIDDEQFRRRRGFASGGAGVLSTLSDLTKFASALCVGGTYEGTKLLGRKTIHLMRQDHLNPQQREDFRFATQGNGWELLQGYSYGLGVRTLASLSESCINGTIGEFGWGSIGGSFVVCDPEEELAICYLQQLRLPNNLENYITPKLKAIVYGALD